MHGRLYNQLDLEIAIVPQTPLLIKSGQKASIDPSLPDMQFVRTRRRAPNGDIDEVVYIPGSSLRGVVRAHAERLLRTIDDRLACSVEATKSCLRKAGVKEDKASAKEIYEKACYACRLFGSTGMASRVQMGDLYPTLAPLSESRFGVAIDRITGAVAVGPFDLEVVTDARFEGRIVLRNFTIGQLGLLSASLLDIADGLVALGHSKSRGLGRVRIEFIRAQFRFARDAQGEILGVGALAEEAVRNAYEFPQNDTLAVEGFRAVRRDTVYHQADSDNDAQIRSWLSKAAPRWLEEVQRAG
jgi:CRISPR-associated RAMP protein (TIGR02581 family)